MGVLIAIVAIVSAVIILPGMGILYSHRKNKDKTEIRKLELQKEILELEIEKQARQINLLEKENEKYDKILEGP
ncbi:MAG: hypothetical protein LBT11_04010 [Treponema sp.]|jgi:hypothetical protein|nr:hypothetical protein [Treponema sp.]